MSADFTFKESFLNALDSLKQDADRALIYAVHVLFSDSPRQEQKQKVCDDIAELGRELGAEIGKFGFKDLTPYTIREREERFIEAAKLLHGRFESFLGAIDKTLAVHVDRNMLFSIADIVDKLGSAKMYSEFGFTKDKVDNLLAIKSLIVDVHKSQIESAVERERNLDRQFIELKEKAFGESLHAKGNRNEVYCFRSVELLKKFMREGANATIVNDDRSLNGNEIGFRIKGEHRIVVEYAFSGVAIEIDLEKGKTESAATYRMQGHIEKGVALVEFKIAEDVSFSNTAAFERVTGIDFLWAQYEKAYLDFQQARRELGKKQEQLDREIVDKAIDDLLFRT